MPGTSGYALSQAGLKRSTGAFIRSGADPPPQPGFPYQMGVSPINMTAPITQTYIYDFGSVGFDFLDGSTWLQMWLVGNSGQNSSGNIGTAGPYTTYLDNIRVLKQLSTDPDGPPTAAVRGRIQVTGRTACRTPSTLAPTLAPVITTPSTTITLDTSATLGQLVFDAVQTSTESTLSRDRIS